MRCVKGLAAVDRRTGVLGVFGVDALLVLFFLLWLAIFVVEVPNVASSSFHVMTVLMVDVVVFGVTACACLDAGGGVTAEDVDVD
jgi:hypothetical protein